MKKHITQITGLLVAVSLIIPVFASAQTDGGLNSQIQSILSQIQSLQQQLATLVQSASSTPSGGAGQPGGGPAGQPAMGTSTPPVPPQGSMHECPNISRNLHIGSSGPDVSNLQDMLSSLQFLSASGTSGYFDRATARALASYQRTFGISTSSSSGVFGSLTRAFLRNHCGPQYGNGMGSTTPPMPPMNGAGNGTSTPPHMGQGPWQGGSSTSPCMGPMIPAGGNPASSTVNTNMMMPNPCEGGLTGGGPGNIGTSSRPMPPVPCNQGTIQNGDSPAAVAAALFMPHSPIPGMMPPCAQQGSGQSMSQGQTPPGGAPNHQ